MARKRNRRVRRGRRGVRRGRGRSIINNGGMIRGRMHPPTNSASPWISYTMTVKWTAAADGNNCVDIKALDKSLRDELGLDAGQKVDLRLRRVDAWTQPQIQNSDKNMIIMSPSDWVGGDKCATNQLNWYEAWGTSVQPAHCHYVWPRSISNVVLPNGFPNPVVTFQVAKGEALILKWHLLWRPSAPDLRSVPGIMTSLRILHHKDEPPDFEILSSDGDAAMSPLAD